MSPLYDCMITWVKFFGGIGGESEIDSLDLRKDFGNFISVWKPLLDIFQETERNEKLILGFDV